MGEIPFENRYFAMTTNDNILGEDAFPLGLFSAKELLMDA
jgi:hypothetical protein